MKQRGTKKKVVRRKVGNECCSFALILCARPITSFKIFFFINFHCCATLCSFWRCAEKLRKFLVCDFPSQRTTRACELRIFALKNNVFNQSEGWFQLAAHASRRSPNRRNTVVISSASKKCTQNLCVWKRHVYGILRIELWTRSQFHLLAQRAQFKQPLSSCDTCA